MEGTTQKDPKKSVDVGNSNDTEDTTRIFLIRMAEAVIAKHRLSKKYLRARARAQIA